MNKSTLCKLFLQILVLCTKHWLNFQEFPFSNKYRRPETRPDIEPEIEFPLSEHITCISICPERIPAPETKVISLLQPLGILAHFPLTVGLHHSPSALGYPIEGWRVERGGLGYPSASPCNYHPTTKPRCASLRGFMGRQILGRSGVCVQCRQFVRVEDSRG